MKKLSLRDGGTSVLGLQFIVVRGLLCSARKFRQKKFQSIKRGFIINIGDLEYLLWITSLFVRIKNVPGHIAEIGVADGRNTVLFGTLIRMYNEGSVRQYVGFDTWDGFVERDLQKSEHLDKSRWKNFSKSSVLAHCKSAGVEHLVELFEGDAVETVPNMLHNHRGKKFQAGMGRYALLYIDCNAYEPALRSMQHFWEFLMPGGLIAIDEKLQGDESSALIDFASEKDLRVERLGSNEVPMVIVKPS